MTKRYLALPILFALILALVYTAPAAAQAGTRRAGRGPTDGDPAGARPPTPLACAR